MNKKKQFFSLCNIETKLHSLYYSIPPISYQNKRKIILFIHNYLSFLTKNTLSYKLNFRSDLTPTNDISTDLSSTNDKNLKPFEIIQYDLSNSSISLNTSNSPIISIIIPVFNQIEYTWRCLKSINEAGSQYSYEIIIVDDSSHDESLEVLNQIQGIRLFHNEKNLGFIRSCNKGAEESKGDYLVFLNNDTQVLPGWLDELIQTFERENDAGIVGAKLFYPDGRLQEAGGIIFHNGMGMNVGKYDDPLKPEYNYLREVDYCSGACIMVRSTLFFQLNKFDERYISGYYEDTDLAFSIRNIGKKVLYQPMSRVIHFEGVTSGTDIKQGVKAHQISNGKKFYRKWRHVLKGHTHFDSQNINVNAHYIKKRLLYIDATTPTPDMDSGSIDSFNYMRIFQSLSFQVTFAPLSNFSYEKRYTRDLQKIGIECLYAPYITNLDNHLKSVDYQYSVVLISRITEAIKSIDLIKKYCPNSVIIFNPVDLHFLRIQRQARLLNSYKLHKKSLSLKNKELIIAKKSDCTIVLSPIEKEILLKENHQLNVEIIPFISTVQPDSHNFEQRNGILFIGNFQHPPNNDAIVYFIEKIWPLIQEKNPGIQFYIIGANPFPQLITMPHQNIYVLGYVKDISKYFNQCKVSVAPIRYGAGLKGKIRTSLSYGLPVVASSVAIEGMGLKHKSEILVADNEIEFANCIIELYNNKVLWTQMKTNGKSFVEKHYSMERCRHKFINIFDDCHKT